MRKGSRWLVVCPCIKEISDTGNIIINRKYYSTTTRKQNTSPAARSVLRIRVCAEPGGHHNLSCYSIYGNYNTSLLSQMFSRSRILVVFVFFHQVDLRVTVSQYRIPQKLIFFLIFLFLPQLRKRQQIRTIQSHMSNNKLYY